jgi:hypothetical protein
LPLAAFWKVHDLAAEQDGKGGRLLLAAFWKVHDLAAERRGWAGMCVKGRDARDEHIKECI